MFAAGIIECSKKLKAKFLPTQLSGTGMVTLQTSNRNQQQQINPG